MLLEPGRMVTADALIECAWENEKPPLDPVAALQNQVSRLRTYLGPMRHLLITRPPGYLLNVRPEDLDAHRFQQLIRESHERAATDSKSALSCLDEALTLWRGPAFAEFAETIARSQAVMLEQLRISAMEEKVDLLLAIGEVSQAIGQAEALNASEPLREHPYAQRMRGLALAGRLNESLAVFQSLRDRLDMELGTEPSEELRQLHVQLLRHEVEKPVALTVGAISGTPPGPHYGQIPLPSSNLVGRVNEIASLTNELGSHRIVSVVGPGGVGKTRLATEVASRLQEKTQLCWVELADLQDDDVVVHAVLESVGMHEASSLPALQRLTSTIGERVVTLILDNCEHVLDGVFTTVQSILAACPNARLLLTSREPLRIDGEKVYQLSPLAVESRDSEAVELFVDRFTSAGFTSAALDAVTMDRIVDIAQSLDGLPLALEIAAASAAELGLEATESIAAMLGLDAGRRTPSSRHQNLRNLLSWSFDRLGPDERDLLTALAVFPSRFSISMVEELQTAASVSLVDTRSTLASLVRKSLVTVNVGPVIEARNHRLLNTVRGFAEERLSSRPEVFYKFRRAHSEMTIDWARSRTEKIRSGDSTEGFISLAYSMSDLRAAYFWARQESPDAAASFVSSMQIFAIHHGEYQILGWAEEMIGSGSVKPPAAIFFMGTNFAIRRGDLDTAEKYARQAIAAAETEVERAFISAGLTHCLLVQGRIEEVVSIGEKCWVVAHEASDYLGAIIHAGTVAIAYSYVGENSKASEWVQRCQHMAADSESILIKAYAAYFVGEASMSTDKDLSLTELSRAYRLATRIDSRFIASISLTSLVTLRARLGKDVSAFDSYHRALVSLREGDDRTALWVTVRNLIPLLSEMEKHDEAYILYAAMKNSRSAPPVYGQEETLLESVIQRATVALDAEALDMLSERARTLEDEDAFQLATRIVSSIDTSTRS
ncbi:AfsR/SARP family transcriptional regulator [Streptomyces cinereoruber]|uniref:AfsR/SARP family transcriptional regulator n=1 Tax=Streptomyces cinereoruber TaxID=67260 RepID=UPI0036304C07